jgi:hypothetical protein
MIFSYKNSIIIIVFKCFYHSGTIAIKNVFGSVVAGAFQITFRAKMHANDVFSFFKNHF